MASDSSSVRAASPASPFQLQFQFSPRSKVQNLLAPSANDSDDEHDIGSARARVVSAFTDMKSEDYPFNSNSKLLQKSPGHIYQGAAQGESGDEENTDFVRPSGRLAARMLEMEGISQHGNDKSKGMSTIRTTESTSFGSPTEDSNAINDSPLSNRKGRICLPRLCTPRLRKASVSPGLFGSSSPRRPCTAADNESDSDELPANQPANDRLKALVETKRQERLAGERGAPAEKAKKIAAQIQQNAMLDEDEDISDDNIESRLAQQARSTKKASRKAQEEILRETQRMSRNMQLTHKPITKKKITKASLFAKFNYKTMDLPDESLTELRSSSSAAPHSDIEMRETPPTSPASRHSESQKPNLAVTGLMPSAEARQAIDEEDFRDLHDAFKCLPSSPSRLLKKGKGEAIGEALPELPPKPSFKQRPIGVQPPRMIGKDYGHGDSDSDLEIVSANTPNLKVTALDSLFDRVPAKQAKESSSLHALRILAHLTASDTQKVRKETKLSMTTSELQLSLQQRARQQAACEREDRLRALRDKGVIIQTAEEREREMAEVEDLISKARREGKQIMRIERAAAKRERRAHVDVDTLDNSSDDEDWEKTENPAEEISGSEEEDKNVDEDDEMTLDYAESVETTISNPMFDDEASKTDEAEHDPLLEEEMAEADEHRAEDEKEDLPAQYLQRSRKTHVLSDEEEDQCQVEDTPSARRTKVPHLLQSDSPGAPTPVLRSATKSFIPGLPVAGPAGLRLTQIFAGTLDESQIDASPTARDSKPREADHYDLVAHLRGCPEPELPDFVSTMSKNTTVDIVMDSQSGLGHVPESQNGDSRTLPMQLQFTLSQTHGFDSPALDPPATQICDMPEPTQDSGFQHMTPIRARFEAPSPKVDKELLAPARESESVEATPVAKKKGKLRRRAPQVAPLSDEYEAVEYDEAEAEDLNINANVFDVMRKASKKKDITVEEFDKTKSVAKDMVHEQAEESEDEYAGLGGASDDESGEDDAFVKEIIDDEGRDDVDEHQLAAFFADRERHNDVKQVEKLYNDITKGMLRRKRGADYELSDSEDGGEARRRMKRKWFAKMRKALLADERIGKIAENPKRQAFLRAIEDRGTDDEANFLDYVVDQSGTAQSQSQSQTEEPHILDSQSRNADPPKRKHSSVGTEAQQRLPPHLRRIKATQRPAGLSEIRESLSSLIEKPNAIVPHTESGSESEAESGTEGAPKSKENRPFVLHRTNTTSIDRIALKRAISSSVSTSARLAFAVSSTQSFKLPQILRRAASNNSIASTSTSDRVKGAFSSMERPASGAGDIGLKMGGRKNSSINHFARECMGKAIFIKTEKRRQQKISKGVEKRRRVIDGLFSKGNFE